MSDRHAGTAAAPAYVDPLDAAPLALADGGYVNAAAGRSYPVVDGVPDFTAGDLPLVPSTARVHRDCGTDFDYRRHYAFDAEYFDYARELPSSAWADEVRRLQEAILAQVPSAPASVLDVGCGKAWLARALLARGGYEVYSSDVSVTNPARAARDLPDARHRVLAADAYFLPFAEASLDCVVAAEVIEHCPDPVRFVASLYRVLRPGGRLIVTTPYAQTLSYNVCVHCRRPTPLDAHLHHFHEGNVGRLVPPGARLHTERFGNGHLVKARTHVLTRRLSHGLWRRVDAAASRAFGRPTRYLLRFDKPA